MVNRFSDIDNATHDKPSMPFIDAGDRQVCYPQTRVSDLRPLIGLDFRIVSHKNQCKAMSMKPNAISFPVNKSQVEMLCEEQSEKTRSSLTIKKVKKNLRIKILILTQLVGGMTMIVWGILKNIQ